MIVQHPGVGVDARPAISAAMASIAASGVPGVVQLVPGPAYELHTWDDRFRYLEFGSENHEGIESAEPGVKASIRTVQVDNHSQRVVVPYATTEDIPAFRVRDLDIRHDLLPHLGSSGQGHAIMASGIDAWIRGFEVSNVVCHVSNGDGCTAYNAVEGVKVRDLSGDCSRNVLTFHGGNGGSLGRAGVDLDGVHKIVGGEFDRGTASIVLDFEPGPDVWWDDVKIRNVTTDAGVHLFFLRGARISRIRAATIACGGVSGIMDRMDLTGWPGDGGDSWGVCFNLMNGNDSDFIVRRSRMHVPVDGAHIMSLRVLAPGEQRNVTFERCRFTLPSANTFHHPSTWKLPILRDCRIERY